MSETIFDHTKISKPTRASGATHVDTPAAGPPIAPTGSPRQEPFRQPRPGADDHLVTIESQREFDLLSGEWQERLFVKMYVAARTSGLLARISDRDWKTLCTLATYMDAHGYCFPSQSELAKALGCSRQMANQRIRSLAEFRFQGQPVLSVVSAERDAQGRWSRNGYCVLPVANLRIFDDQPEPDGPVTGNCTVSNKLDTVNSDPTGSTTVSSSTVTVGLDTNYNQKTNENEPDRYNSNFRKVSQSLETERDAATTSDQTHAASNNTPAGFQPVREILTARARRRSASHYDEDRQIFIAYLQDFAREFADRAPLKSSVTRCYNLFKRSGLDRDTFIQALYQARAITKERTASIRTESKQPTSYFPTKHKMAYFFACLEQLLGLNESDAASPQDRAEAGKGGEQRW